MPRTVKLLANAHSEVKFALNFAIRRNFTHRVNFTIADNFTCPKGKLSFSVFSVKDNTLRESRFSNSGIRVSDVRVFTLYVIFTALPIKTSDRLTFARVYVILYFKRAMKYRRP